MTAIQTKLGGRDQALNTIFGRTATIPQTNVQRAIEYVMGVVVALPIPPSNADYIVGTANAGLSAERVATDTATVNVDITTPGQALFHVLEVPGIAGTGIVVRTAAGTYTARTLTGTANEITVTNGSGVSGNPTLSIPTAVTFTGKTITGGAYTGATWDNGIIGGTTPAAITGTVITGNRFVPNSATVPTNGMYLPAANTLGWAINSAAELQLDGTALSPAADGGSSLGTTALGWQNLFSNTGFVWNIEGGNWVATHTSGIVTVGTGDLRVTTAGTNSASVVTVGGTQTLTAKTLTSPAINTGTIGTSLVPTSNDGAALGNATNQFSDLFLAEGGVINWDNGDATITQTGNALAFAGLATITADVTGFTLNGAGNVGLELGRTDANSSTPFIDFHSGATAVDYDARIIVSGGTGSNAGGTVNFDCATVQLSGVPIYTNLPQNSQSTAYTTVLADAQKHILHPTADNNARTFTIAANASVAYPVGTAITFVNQINVVTIAINSDTLVLAGTGTTGSRSLAANGMATALKIASTTWMISGSGLT